ncbi:uncharacterized protein LOC134272026 [Saccostrea cucullata]|uniref:uncharacterized protein LOC134272026 n=1 Tax=Saccostrea cuccullata TaxID=36930 RepID=UPI002ED08579
MLLRILQLSFLPFLICFGLKSNEKDDYIFQEDSVHELLNTPDSHTFTTQQLKTILTAFQKDYLTRISKLQNDFELTLRHQENRIQSLEKKTAEQERIISTLQHDVSAVSPNQKPSNSHMHEKKESLKSKDDPTGEVNVTDAFSTNDVPGNLENKDVSILKSKQHEGFGRKERLLIPDVPGAVVAFYAYMSSDLPSNVATPHHVLIFDHVKTNIGNGYHPSTGVFIAPETGVYVFIWTFRNADGGVHSTQLMINSEEWGKIEGRTPSHDSLQSTGCVVAHVNKGDDVFVKTSDSSSGYIYSNIYGKTPFSGWKID